MPAEEVKLLAGHKGFITSGVINRIRVMFSGLSFPESLGQHRGTQVGIGKKFASQPRKPELMEPKPFKVT